MTTTHKTMIASAALGLAILAGLFLYAWQLERGAPSPQIAGRSSPGTPSQPTAQPSPDTPAAQGTPPSGDAPPAANGNPTSSPVGGRAVEAPPAAGLPSAPDAAASSDAGQRPVAPGAADAAPVPSFDIVRVEPSGEMVVAGLASPGWTVELLTNGEVVGSGVADKQGDWVIVPDEPLVGAEQILSLRSRSPDGREEATSRQRVAVGVGSEGQAPLVLLDTPERPSEVLQAPGAVAGLSPPPAAQSEARGAGAAGAAAEPQASLMARVETPSAAGTVSAGTARSGVGAGAAGQGLAVGAVEYEEAGRLYVSGSASAGARLRVYLNDTFLTESQAGTDRKFVVDLDVRLPPGQYRVRVDQVESEAGQVASRVEVPYAREIAPPALAATGGGAGGAGARGGAAGFSGAASTAEADVSGALGLSAGSSASSSALEPKVVVIRRGDNLWRIARQTYGRGVRYTSIYEANVAQIRNPDLIYPEQIFVLPLPQLPATAAN